MPHPALEARVLDADLAESWEAVISWLRGLDDEILDAATPLPGWNVRHVVAHLGLAMNVLATAQPVPPEETAAVPLDLAAYLASYRDSASGILESALARAEQYSGELVGAVDAVGMTAIAALQRLRRDGVSLVRVRRGPVDLTDLVLTRLIEIVVHGDDLARATHVPSPVDPTARTAVAHAFVTILNRRSGYDLQVGDERAWIRLAAGRLRWDERGDALRSGNLAEGLPDLRTFLPLL